jgi:hypothetical protein
VKGPLRLLRAAAPMVFCAAGLVTGHGPIVLTRFARIQNDLGDSRFVNYLFEHSWLWLLRNPHHARFWDPQFFYPAPNVGAYAESMLGSAPFYWSWRAMGFAADTSFQLWLLLVSALNFAAAYWLLRRPLKLGVIASCGGAFLFAFAASRINQTQHHQLFPHFFTAIAVGALWLALQDPGGARARHAIWAFGLCCALQLYASIYLGWFLAFGLLLAAVWALPFSPWRNQLFGLVRAQWRTLALTGVVCIGLLAWMLLHYARAAGELGGAAWSEVTNNLPRAVSWVHVGPQSWLYGWTANLAPFKDLPMDNEQRLGIGYATTLLALAGLSVRRRGGVGLMALLLVTTVAIVSLYAGDFSPWRGVYAVVPGAQAIRGVCRIALALLLPASIGLAHALEWLAARAWWWAALLLAALSAAEQGETTPSYDKAANRADIDAVAQLVDPQKCDAFYFSPIQGQMQYWKYQLDAVWAHAQTGVPTINGYSRTGPRGWGLNEPNINYEGEEDTLRAALLGWEQQTGLNPSRVCWVKRKVRDGPNQADFVAQTVPTEMISGQSYDAEVTMRNPGDSIWTPQDQYRIGSQAPQDNKIFVAAARVDLSGPVPPGGSATFRFRVVAPAPGRYAFRWRMLRESVMWFGEYSRPDWIDVRAAPPP